MMVLPGKKSDKNEHNATKTAIIKTLSNTFLVPEIACVHLSAYRRSTSLRLKPFLSDGKKGNLALTRFRAALDIGLREQKAFYRLFSTCRHCRANWARLFRPRHMKDKIPPIFGSTSSPGLIWIITIKSLKVKGKLVISELTWIVFAITKMAKDFVNSFDHSPFLVEVRLYWIIMAFSSRRELLFCLY